MLPKVVLVQLTPEGKPMDTEDNVCHNQLQSVCDRVVFVLALND